MKGFTTIFGHKKWCFLYVVTIMSFYALMNDKLDGGHFMGIIATLGTIVTTMSAAEKSKWRKDGN